MKTYKRKTGLPGNRLTHAIKLNKRAFIILVTVVGLVVAGIILVYQFSAQRSFGSSFLVTEDTIHIGLRTDITGFGEMDENGNISGFDRDFIDEALHRLLPEREKLIEYIPITSQNAGSNIKYGVTNINLGLIVDGTDRAKSFRVTRPYYTDNVVAVVQGSSRLDKLTAMENGKIGVLSGALPMDDVEKYLDRSGLDYTLLRYSDYESAMTDVEQGRANAVIVPYAIARQFEAAGFRVLAEPLYQIGYSVMLPTGQAAFTNELDRVIGQMEQDGTLEALREKWGL